MIATMPTQVFWSSQPFSGIRQGVRQVTCPSFLTVVVTIATASWRICDGWQAVESEGDLPAQIRDCDWHRRCATGVRVDEARANALPHHWVIPSEAERRLWSGDVVSAYRDGRTGMSCGTDGAGACAVSVAHSRRPVSVASRSRTRGGWRSAMTCGPHMMLRTT
jgi:hypothetical protein